MAAGLGLCVLRDMAVTEWDASVAAPGHDESLVGPRGGMYLVQLYDCTAIYLQYSYIPTYGTVGTVPTVLRYRSNCDDSFNVHCD